MENNIMTTQEAIRILDPETSADAIAEIKYNAGFDKDKVIKKVDEACKLACNIMRKYSAIVKQLGEEREYSYADFEQYAELHGIDSEDDWFYAGLKRAIELVKVGEEDEID